MKNVAISISLLHASSRDFLSGVFRFLESRAEWNLSIYQREESSLSLEKAVKANKDAFDGIILTEVEPDSVIDALCATRIPVVTVGFSNSRLQRRDAPTMFIRCDNTSIGALCARYFCGLGRFNSFGFVPPNDATAWAEDRMVGFSDELAQRGAAAAAFPIRPGAEDEWDMHGLAKWLNSLKKPAAVMAACDRCAVRVIAAAEHAGLNIPQQISLVGVDNDEFICLHASPPISSIMPGHGELGQLAARTMDRMMSRRHGKQKPQGTVVVARMSGRVVERESSRPLPPASQLVERAKRFILENACGTIRVDDVADHVGVSRRLLEMRMREIDGSTVRGLIEDARFAVLKRLLSATSRPLASIARECGYSDAHVLAHLFKKRTGMSMREFRRRENSNRS